MAPRYYERFDEEIIRRVMNNELPPRAFVPYSDRAEAIRRLTLLGYSDGQTAYLLRCSRRSVIRTRSRRGVAAAIPKDTFRGVHRVNAPCRPQAAG